MNIFFTNRSPLACAAEHCDQHVIKMTVETAQLLSTVIQRNLCKPIPCLYKITHQFHPCAVWAGQSKQHFDWLLNFGFALASEFTERYGKRHKSEDIMDICKLISQNEPLEFNYTGFTDPPKIMPHRYRLINDTCAAYQAFICGEKRFARWKFRNPPAWYTKPSACPAE